MLSVRTEATEGTKATKGIRYKGTEGIEATDHPDSRECAVGQTIYELMAISALEGLYLCVTSVRPLCDV